jgi:hypothetical protein
MTDAPRLSRGKAALLTTMLVVLFTVGTVVLLEGSASTYLFARDYLGASAPASLVRPLTVRDTLLGWRNQPGYTGLNEYGDSVPLTLGSQGFRESGAASAGTATTGTRLVCSGDELTLGAGVADDHHWCGLLQRELPGLQTVNMGADGYSVDQSLLWYRRDGAALAPRVHLVALTQASLNRSATGSHEGWFKPYLELDGSRLATRNVPVPAQEEGALRQVAARRANDELRLVQLVRSLRGIDRQAEIAAATDARLAVVEAALGELASTTRAQGGTLVLAYLPIAREARQDEHAARRRRLAEWARAREIPFIDLTPGMHAMRPDSLDLSFIRREAASARPRRVGQYSNIGHVWIARSLARELAALPALAAAPPSGGVAVVPSGR